MIVVMRLTLQEYLSGVESGALDPREVVSHYLQKNQHAASDLFAFVRMHDRYVDQHLDTLLQ